MKAVLVAACLLGFPARSHAQDNVIGLLTLPEVFGAGPCDRFEPEAVQLYDAPAPDQSIGAIRVDRYWTFHGENACEGLVVNVYIAGAAAAEKLPTREYEYEAPAAIVVEHRGRWFRVRIANGTAWLIASNRAAFHPLEQLLADGLTHLTDASDGRLVSSPGSCDDPGGRVRAYRAVRVKEFRQYRDRLWVQVKVLSHSACESGGEPIVIASGWLQAHGLDGNPAVWFSSRGC